MKQIPLIDEFRLEDTPKTTVRHYWLKLISDGLANPVSVPLLVARGKKDGPVIGLTAAIHGNELNGISVIQRLFNEIDVHELNGTIIGIPIVNVPSFIRKRRRFNDGVDLNHIMPGKENGTVSELYAYRFFHRIVTHFDYLLDLHTASSGRINSYYIRADMDNPEVRELALLQNASIIVHNPPSDGTLRGAAAALDIPAITVEVGNPDSFQKRMIRSGMSGIHNVLCHLGLILDESEINETKTILCKKSYWVYADRGGLLTVHVDLLDRLEKNQLIATLRDIFGQTIKKYYAPEKGVVIGKSVNPVNQSGGRILHLGIE